MALTLEGPGQHRLDRGGILFFFIFSCLGVIEIAASESGQSILPEDRETAECWEVLLFFTVIVKTVSGACVLERTGPS